MSLMSGTTVQVRGDGIVQARGLTLLTATKSLDESGRCFLPRILSLRREILPKTRDSPAHSIVLKVRSRARGSRKSC